MDLKNIQSEASEITRITTIGMFANIGLAAVKLVVGVVIGSLSLIADGIHSLSDLVTDVAVLIGTWIGSRPPDRNHPFGHGKFETVAAMVVAVVLMLSGGWIVRDSVISMGEVGQLPNGWWIITVAVLSIGVKELLYHVSLRVAERCRSEALRANAWHHRSDALSSVVVLAGGGLAVVGWNYGDSGAGMLVGAIVVIVGGKIGFGAIAELIERSAGDEVEERIHRTIARFDEVRGWHKLRTRRIGRELQMDVHITLDADLKLIEAHEIVRQIEEAVAQTVEWPISQTIHVDPDTDSVREMYDK